MERTLLLQIAEWLGVLAVMMIAGMSARLKLRPLVFKYPRREATVSLALFVLILIFAFLVFGGTVTGGQASAAPGDLGQRLFVAAAAVLPFAAALLTRRQPVRSAGWGKDFLAGGIRVAAALVFLTIFLTGSVFRLLAGLSTEDISALVYLLLICLAEETIFRGYIQLRLEGWLGPRYGWAAAAVLFTLFQLPRLLLLPAELPLRLGLTLVQGLVLGWVMRKSRHVAAPWLYRAVSEWLRWI